MINNAGALYAMGLLGGGRHFGGYSNNQDDRGQPKRYEYILFALTSLGFILCLIFGIVYFKYMAEEETYYGKLEYKWHNPTKSGTYYYFEVKFDSIPAKAEFLVTHKTYHKSKVGEWVSFRLSNDEIVKYCYPEKALKHMFLWVLYIMYPIVYLIIFCGFHIALIKYMFGKNSSLYKHKEI